MSKSEKKDTDNTMLEDEACVIRMFMTGDTVDDRSMLAILFGEVVDIITHDGSTVSGQVMHYFSPDENETDRASIFVMQKDAGNVVELYQNEIEYVDIIRSSLSQPVFPS